MEDHNQHNILIMEDNEMPAVKEVLDKPAEDAPAVVGEILQDLTDKAVTSHTNHEALKEEEAAAETITRGDLVDDVPASITLATNDDGIIHAPVDRDDESALQVDEELIQDEDKGQGQDLIDEVGTCHTIDHTASHEEALTAEKEEDTVIIVDILRDSVDDTASSILHVTCDDATTHTPIDQGDESTLPVEEAGIQDQEQDLTHKAGGICHHTTHTTTTHEEAPTTPTPTPTTAAAEYDTVVIAEILKDLVDSAVASTYQERQQTVASSGKDSALAQLLARVSAEEQRRATPVIVISSDEESGGDNDDNSDDESVPFTALLAAAQRGRKRKASHEKRQDNGGGVILNSIEEGGGETYAADAVDAAAAAAAAIAIDRSHRLASDPSREPPISITSSSPVHSSPNSAPSSSSNGIEAATSTTSSNDVSNNIVNTIQRRRAEIIFYKHALPARQKGRYDRPSSTSSSSDGDDDDDDEDASSSGQSTSDDDDDGDDEEDPGGYGKSPSPVFRYKPVHRGGIVGSGSGVSHGKGNRRIGGSSRKQQKPSSELIDLTLDSSAGEDETQTGHSARKQDRAVTGSKRKHKTKTTAQKESSRIVEGNQPSRKKQKKTRETTEAAAVAAPPRAAAAAAPANQRRAGGEGFGRIAARLAAAAERKKRGRHWRYRMSE